MCTDLLMLSDVLFAENDAFYLAQPPITETTHALGFALPKQYDWGRETSLCWLPRKVLRQARNDCLSGVTAGALVYLVPSWLQHAKQLEGFIFSA